MKLAQTASTLAFAAAATMSQASPPAIGTWVEIHVFSCQAATFEAPPYPSSIYVAGTSAKTAVIRGRIVSSGTLPHFSNLDQSIEEEVKKQLPKVNEIKTVVTSGWSEEICKSVFMKNVRFNYNYACDTVPLQGTCMIPIQMVDLAPQSK